MGKLSGIFKRVSGTIGDITFSHSKNNTVSAREKVLTNKSRSFAQMRQRVKWSNPVKTYRVINGQFVHSYEEQKGNHYQTFMHYNSQIAKVFLTKREADLGACVVDHFCLSSGRLASIQVELDSDHKAHTNLSLGGLVIDEQTTVGDFSTAIITHNKGFVEGDFITAVYLQQQFNDNLGIPFVELNTALVKLDQKQQDCPLWLLGTRDFFCSDQGVLSSSIAILGGITWLHTRVNVKGNVDSSTQNLAVWNPMLDEYSSKEALNQAINSYGGADSTSPIAPTSEEWDEFVDRMKQTVNPGSNPSGGDTPASYVITLTASPQAGGTVTGAGSYASGAQAQLVATPNAGYTFTRWSDGTTQASRTLTVTESKTLTAVFTANNGGASGGSDSGVEQG